MEGRGALADGPRGRAPDFAIASVGRVSANNRDAIPMAADFILRREDIDTVHVFGVVEDRIGRLAANQSRQRRPRAVHAKRVR